MLPPSDPQQKSGGKLSEQPGQHLQSVVQQAAQGWQHMALVHQHRKCAPQGHPSSKSSLLQHLYCMHTEEEKTTSVASTQQIEPM
jgi:hypothetical protein